MPRPPAAAGRRSARSERRSAAAGRVGVSLTPSGLSLSRRLRGLAASGRCALRDLAGELVVGRLAVDGLEIHSEYAHLAAGVTDPELLGEAEHRVLDCRLGVAALGARERLEGGGLAAEGRRRGVAIRERHSTALHPEPLVGQGRELLEDAALLALDDALERVGLFVRGVLINNDPELPVPRRQVRGKQVDQPEVDPGQVGVVEIAVSDLKDADTVTLTVVAGRGRVDGTGTEQVAGAAGQISPGDLPSHVNLPGSAAGAGGAPSSGGRPGRPRFVSSPSNLSGCSKRSQVSIS